MESDTYMWIMAKMLAVRNALACPRNNIMTKALYMQTLSKMVAQQ